jgi:hypothetical protein
MDSSTAAAPRFREKKSSLMGAAPSLSKPAPAAQTMKFAAVVRSLKSM